MLYDSITTVASTSDFKITTGSSSWFVVKDGEFSITQDPIEELREKIFLLKEAFFKKKFNSIPFNCRAPIPPEEIAIQRLMQ